ncbi:hypothetical protein [Leadbetterella byssophila]|uniref:hypothetical protein n=1 Tax=Leadbetterella byssophila TaxID=316068 RepID=UPI00399F57E1
MTLGPKVTLFEGFSKGYKALNDDHKDMVKVRIMRILGISNRVSFGQYKNGQQDIKDPEKKARVQALFEEYGVTDPWGK